jgi:hypothetical protein
MRVAVATLSVMLSPTVRYHVEAVKSGKEVKICTHPGEKKWYKAQKFKIDSRLQMSITQFIRG